MGVLSLFFATLVVSAVGGLVLMINVESCGSPSSSCCPARSSPWARATETDKIAG
jgi:hypothetical protein